MTGGSYRAIYTILACLFSACGCSVQPYCELAPRSDGWRYVASPPPELAVEANRYTRYRQGRILIWARHSNGNYFMCFRPEDAAGCGEIGNEYALIDGSWQVHPQDAVEQVRVCG